MVLGNNLLSYCWSVAQQDWPWNENGELGFGFITNLLMQAQMDSSPLVIKLLVSSSLEDSDCFCTNLISLVEELWEEMWDYKATWRFFNVHPKTLPPNLAKSNTSLWINRSYAFSWDFVVFSTSDDDFFGNNTGLMLGRTPHQPTICQILHRSSHTTEHASLGLILVFFVSRAPFPTNSKT